METDKKIYFAHPISEYQNDEIWLEKISLLLFQLLGENLEIENPNQAHHEAGYQKAKRESGNGMIYFFDLIKSIPMAVFLAFKDGMISAGVFSEIQFMFKNGAKILEFTRDGRLVEIDSIDENRRLSVEETKNRLKQLM